MWFVYDLISFFLVLFYVPLYLCRRRFHKGFSRRFGILPKHIFYKRPLWVHAVSVGEAQSVKQLVKGLRAEYGQRDFVLSTVTPTGNTLAQSMAAPNDFVTYLPLDFRFIVSRVVDQLEPAAFIIAETELWPNLLTYAYAKAIPVIIVNGRVSDRSFKRYSLVKFMIEPLLSRISVICAQTERDKERFCALGARGDTVQVTGNMKFDIQECVIPPEQIAAARRRLGMKADTPLLVAGSTHPGEEEILLQTYRALLSDFPSLKLVIAPRHPERASEVKKCASGLGISALCLSEVDGLADVQVYILDTIGELMKFYALADVVFVGGSLVKKGGHNVLEPACLAKPVVVGPHMFNFSDITELFLTHEALVMVPAPVKLREQLAFLLENPACASTIGENGRRLILEQKGATQRNIGLIKEYVKK